MFTGIKLSIVLIITVVHTELSDSCEDTFVNDSNHYFTVLHFLYTIIVLSRLGSLACLFVCTRTAIHLRICW